MELRPDISFESYDRLFPNQDFMPVGGFGNLIALPLQKEARERGFSQFVDANLVAYPDQWSFLAKVKTLSSEQLSHILSSLEQKDTPTNMALNNPLPWERNTPENALILNEIKNAPQSIGITLANHMYFSLQEIPSVLFKRMCIARW